MVVYPTKRELMDAIVQVLSQDEVLSTSEINQRVSDLLNLSEEQLTLESSTAPAQNIVIVCVGLVQS